MSMESKQVVKSSQYLAMRAKKRRDNGLQQVFEWLVLIVSVAMFVLPFVNIFAQSTSSARAIVSGEVSFWPVDFTWEAWQQVFNNQSMTKAFIFTVFLTASYTVLAELMIMFAAYPLSKKGMRGRGPVLTFFMITMFFGGGLIPFYLLVQMLGMLDTFWVLLVPGAFSVYNMLILKSFFQEIPDSLEESAKIDGASDFLILFRIYFPLSLPALATLALFFAVGKWNSFSDAIFFMPTNRDMTPIQLVLQRILQVVKDKEVTVKDVASTVQTYFGNRVSSESIKAASILFTVVPIIMVYPWLQKYFVKGVMIGSIKG